MVNLCVDCRRACPRGCSRCSKCQAITVALQNARRDQSRRNRGVRTGTTTLYRNERQAALVAAGHVCTVPGCGSDYRLEAHHVIPKADGGPDHRSNLRILCAPHHVLAGRGLL